MLPSSLRPTLALFHRTAGPDLYEPRSNISPSGLTQHAAQTSRSRLFPLRQSFDETQLVLVFSQCRASLLPSFRPDTGNE